MGSDRLRPILLPLDDLLTRVLCTLGDFFSIGCRCGCIASGYAAHARDPLHYAIDFFNIMPHAVYKFFVALFQSFDFSSLQAVKACQVALSLFSALVYVLDSFKNLAQPTFLLSRAFEVLGCVEVLSGQFQ